MSSKLTYLIAIVGDKGVGKSTLISILKTEQLRAEYTPTLGAAMYNFSVPTNYGIFGLTVWDCGGEFDLKLLPEIDGAIIMGSATSRCSVGKMLEIKEILSQCQPDTKIVAVVNKSDLVVGYPSQKVLNVIDFSDQLTGYTHFMSQKHRLNVIQPFHEIMKKMSSCDDLKFL